MITRRKALGGIAGIIASGIAPYAASGALRRGLALKDGMLQTVGGGGGWTNPYVTDGLVAMWDGEWNVAGGTHNPSATTWIDLVGGKELSLNGSASFGSNYMETTDHISGAIGDFTFSGVNTVEIVLINNDDWDEWESIFDDINGIWFWGAIASGEFDGFRSYYDLEYGSHIIMSISNNLNRIYQNGIEYNNGMLNGDEGLGDFSIFGNYDNVGEDRCMKGRCYSVRIYNRQLTSAEVFANYAIDQARFGIT